MNIHIYYAQKGYGRDQSFLDNRLSYPMAAALCLLQTEQSSWLTVRNERYRCMDSAWLNTVERNKIKDCQT